MAPTIAYTLPAMQLVCNLVMPGTPGSDSAFPGLIANHSPPQNESGNLPEGYTAYPDIGTAYKIYDASITWKLARERCIAEGAHLAVIDSHLKLDHLLAQAESSTSNTIHVGIHSMYEEPEWVSATTRATLENLPWASGDPSGGFHLVAASKDPRGLRNFHMTSQCSYVCELPIPENFVAKRKLL